ncbi:hypothetical protein ACFLTX_00015 [Chloroflexota bacterium]
MGIMLQTYDAFIARVEAIGFFPFSQIISGLPSMVAETPKEIWHTGLESDPWRWKDRAAEEKRLAYGCILGGHKGFITRRMYPIFYTAYHPFKPMPDRWSTGTINQMTWKIWGLFEETGVLTISQVRKMLGVSRRKGGSAADAAIKILQQEFYITMDGSERKINARGEFYGWPVNRYRRVVDWVSEGWLNTTGQWDAVQAGQSILDEGMAMSVDIDRKVLAKKFKLP